MTFPGQANTGIVHSAGLSLRMDVRRFPGSVRQVRRGSPGPRRFRFSGDIR